MAQKTDIAAAKARKQKIILQSPASPCSAWQ